MSEFNRTIFSGMQILTNHAWAKDQAVVVEDEKIKAIIPDNMIKHHMPAARFEFTENHYLVPGFIDLHIHGAHGKDVMDASEEALHVISRSLAAEGVTGFLPTTLTASSKQIERVLKNIASTPSPAEGAAILGVHLEGPFIAPSRMGAQRGDEVQLPDIALLKQWQHAAQGNIKVVTLAPELPGALPLIEALRDMDIVASIGHTNATYEEVSAAIAAGSTQATHLFNAMRGMHQREPGTVAALLLASDVIVELIADGLHGHPAMIELAYKLKGKDRVLLVTDAMRAKCLGDGHYDLGGQSVQAQSGKVTLANGTLAGSTLRMPEAIRNMTQFSKCTLIDAIYMASRNPARVLRLDNRKGTIEVGNDADLVVLNTELEVVLTMREGREIFRV